MSTLENKTVVVAGGTGNVGAFIVKALLEQGATVVVPSRSDQKLSELRTYLSHHRHGVDLDRLKTFIGDLSDEAGAAQLLQQITHQLGAPDAAIATLGSWHSVPSLLSTATADLERVLQNYLIAHFRVARTFLPGLKASGGIYVSINGLLAFNLWPGSALVSVATAGQHMLFRALAQELEGSSVQVVELVSHVFIRDKQTQPGSPLPGEAVGTYVAHLVSGAARSLHGQSIQLRSLEQLKEAGLNPPTDDPEQTWSSWGYRKGQAYL
jgi:NAD(P)-dependent dehydrogenase (short-subunit alcohol dehydrogenase family)